VDFELPTCLDALATEAARLASDWAARGPFPDDTWIVGYDASFAAELARRGWIGMTWPVSDGGHGRSALERFVVFEQLIAGGAPIAAMWFADRQIGPSLLQFGSPEQRRRWLPGILDGSSMWCIGMSEPDNGSDVAGLRTRAVRDGDDWIVTGQKVWTSGAAVGDWIYLIARTDPDAPPHAGLSDLVVDLRTPGIEIRRIVDMTGNDHFCEVVFDEVRVPGANLVGECNGSFRQVMRQMEHERGGIDRLVSNRLLFESVRRSAWIEHDDPLVRQELARLEIGYRIGRLLVLREVLGQGPPHFSAATKVICTEYEQDVAAFCARVAGPWATLFDARGDLPSRVARGVCYAPAYTIMGGTTQILRNIVGERMLGLPR
jgi:alkylation response protein AidB-like acyl-CoA dehydrogenase